MGWGFSLRIFIRLFRYRFKLGKLAKHPWNSECLAFSEGQVFRCMSWRTRGWQEGNLDYDSEPERTLLRRRREARRRERQAALEQQLNMASKHHDDNLNLENNQN
ncbi:hypothetical protein PIB30_039860 [Stylosanthes scabra]|uniref:Uncharacterized protein n=1 Tax=Stylosanthes scabra TaxID=79078 RepID=A0ABU6UD46_9FABA|nr:hypothetical protein [Stylosanthes scabra]